MLVAKGMLFVCVFVVVVEVSGRDFWLSLDGMDFGGLSGFGKVTVVMMIVVRVTGWILNERLGLVAVVS